MGGGASAAMAATAKIGIATPAMASRKGIARLPLASSRCRRVGRSRQTPLRRTCRKPWIHRVCWRAKAPVLVGPAVRVASAGSHVAATGTPATERRTPSSAPSATASSSQPPASRSTSTRANRLVLASGVNRCCTW
jgi:hypothetical protein